MKKIYSLIALAMTSFGFAQYSGQGTFIKITDINNLTDGYYVITNQTSEFVMTSNVNTSGNNNYFEKINISELTVNNENIIDPNSSYVWKIETSGNNKTIYNELTEKYVSWTSGNSATGVTTVTNNSKWNITFVAGTTAALPNRIAVNNVNTPARQLSYNSSAPRFAAYSNTDQQELQLYKLVEEETPVEPVEPVAPTASFDLQDALTITPSLDDASSFFGNAVVTIANLGEGQTASLSLENTENFEIITPVITDLENGTHSIQIRFNAQGLAANSYTTNLNVVVDSQTPALATLEIVGVVSPSLSNNQNTIEGLNIYPNPANDVVTITSAANGVKNVQLFDVTGKQIMNVETSSTINVSSLAKGIYVMKVTEAGKSATSKLVIK